MKIDIPADMLVPRQIHHNPGHPQPLRSGRTGLPGPHDVPPLAGAPCIEDLLRGSIPQRRQGISSPVAAHPAGPKGYDTGSCSSCQGSCHSRCMNERCHVGSLCCRSRLCHLYSQVLVHGAEFERQRKQANQNEVRELFFPKRSSYFSVSFRSLFHSALEHQAQTRQQHWMEGWCQAGGDGRV